MVLRDRGVSYRITFVSNVIVRDADRLLAILSSRREHCRVLESCYVLIYRYLYSPVFHFPQCLTPVLFPSLVPLHDVGCIYVR